MKVIDGDTMTRREAMGTIGGAVAGAMLGATTSAFAERKPGAATKTLQWTASLTPCDKNLKFDPGAFRDMLSWFKQQGAGGIVVLGTTGEFPSFSVAERKQIAEVAGKHKQGMNVIVNPGTSNFPETLELSRHAADHGADGLLVIPPFYYNEPSLDGLTRYYSMLFEQVHVPISLYHIPGTSGVSIKHELLRSLMHYPHLAGIKDSTGDAPGYLGFVQSFPELNMCAGTNNNLEVALDHGMGAILADGNLSARLSADVFNAYHANQDYKPALARLRAAQRVWWSVVGYSFGPMKYALSLQMGVAPTYQRPPYPDVTDAQKVAIKSALDQIKDL